MKVKADEGATLPAPAQARVATLFDTHVDRLYRIARRLVSSRDDALDLVQETFLKVAQSPQTVPHGAQDEEAWLVRVLVNIRRDQWRRATVRRLHEPRLRESVIAQDNPEGTYVSQATVWRALDHLSPRRRAVLVMSELEGMEMPAIASMLGISVITVRWHLARARRELARRIQDQEGAHNEQVEIRVAGRRPAASRSSTP
jgi:RNA polymerase sigma-70 factor, ECF subfamily